jgi:uncharacterized protein
MTTATTRPDSPCVGVCSTLYTTYCNGCGRHYMEVANWVAMSDEEKEAVWKRLESYDLKEPLK